MAWYHCAVWYTLRNQEVQTQLAFDPYWPLAWGVPSRLAPAADQEAQTQLAFYPAALY